MKRLNSILCGTLMALVLTLFLGCKKLQDYILKHPGSTHPDCRISKFISNSNYPQKTGVVYYNKHGNPDSVIFDYTSTGQPNLHFFYDKKNRLTDCIGMYGNGGGNDTTKPDYTGPAIPNDLIATFLWHKYIYDEKNRVIGDTTYAHLLYEPGSFKPINWAEYDLGTMPHYISHYTLDSKDRIIKKITTVYPNLTSDTINYTYGQDGNLVFPGIHYDNNINFLRTHKIWMLLSLDYSVNNPFTAAEYNNKGLPTNLGPNTPPYYYSFLYTSLKNMTIIYHCK